MLPDQFFPINTWVELYAETGITPGVSLKVTNKTHFQTYAWEGDTPPPSIPDMLHGEPVAFGESVRNTDMAAGFWVLSYAPGAPTTNKGRISVQEWAE